MENGNSRLPSGEARTFVKLFGILIVSAGFYGLYWLLGQNSPSPAYNRMFGGCMLMIIALGGSLMPRNGWSKWDRFEHRFGVISLFLLGMFFTVLGFLTLG